MAKDKVDKSYVSDTDKFLESISTQFDLSESQKKEIEKHQEIFDKRDNPQPKSKKRLVDF